MRFKNTFELISKDIQDIEYLVSNFQNSSNLPAIELDLLLSKLRNVYDLILMIKNHELTNASANVAEVEEKTSVKEVKVEDIVPSVLPVEIPEIAPEPIVSNPTEDEKVENIAEDKEISSTKQQLKAKILSDKFENNNEFLNEKIGSQSEILSKKIQSGPIENIASSIGINDKFYFARELFHGKAEDFKKAIEILDKAANFNEAYIYISNHFSWDMNDEPVQNLLNLIRRKFISSNNE